MMIKVILGICGFILAYILIGWIMLWVNRAVEVTQTNDSSGWTKHYNDDFKSEWEDVALWPIVLFIILLYLITILVENLIKIPIKGTEFIVKNIIAKPIVLITEVFRAKRNLKKVEDKKVTYTFAEDPDKVPPEYIPYEGMPVNEYLDKVLNIKKKDSSSKSSSDGLTKSSF